MGLGLKLEIAVASVLTVIILKCAFDVDGVGVVAFPFCFDDRGGGDGVTGGAFGSAFNKTVFPRPPRCLTGEATPPLPLSLS